MVDRHLSKSVSKNPPPLPAQKLHGKAVLSYTLWLNSNKIDDINILQSADKERKPSFHIHAPGSKRRCPCT